MLLRRVAVNQWTRIPSTRGHDPDVVPGYGIIQHVRNDVVLRPALWKRLNGPYRQPLRVRLSIVNVGEVNIRWPFSLRRKQAVRAVGRPDRRRIVIGTERRSDRRWARKIHHPDRRDQIELINRDLLASS